MKRRPLPPYGRTAFSVPRGHPLELIVYAGAQPGSRAWQLAKRMATCRAGECWRAVAVWAPPHGQTELPAASSYAWPVRGLDVLVFVVDWLPDGTLESLAHELLAQGAAVVRACGRVGPGDASLRIWRP